MPAAFCVHCDQAVVHDVGAIAQSEMERLRDHLMGCPSALRACAPALPLFGREADVLLHFRVEGAPPAGSSSAQ
jgi:hypothetical protein